MTTTLPLKDGEDIEYITTPELIEEKFGKEVELIIDGGIEHRTFYHCELYKRRNRNCTSR